MKTSLYKSNHGVYLAILEGREVTRGSIQDLAAALAQLGITAGDLLLGDWRQDAQLLNSSEQSELHVAMTVAQGESTQPPGLNASMTSDRVR